MEYTMKPARIPNELPQKFLLIWMFAFLAFLWVFSLLIPILLPEKLLWVVLVIWILFLFAVFAVPLCFDKVVFPEGIQLRLFGKPIRHLPVSSFKILCAVGDDREHYLCLSIWDVEELAKQRERVLQKGVFTRHDLPFLKRSPGWQERLAREYLLNPRQILRNHPILWLPFDPVLVIYLRRMYPQLPYVDLRSGRTNRVCMYPANQIPLTNQHYRLDKEGVHLLDSSGKRELNCLNFQQIQTILRVDRFVNMSKVEPGHGSYLVVSQKSIPELAEHGKKMRWHKWKKQIVEQMPEAEEMYAAEFHFSGFFTWNARTAKDCHMAYTPELEKQLRNLCPHARWVDYSNQWQQ